MKVEIFQIKGPCLLTPHKYEDDRGFLMETYQKETFEEITGTSISFVQDNHSLSKYIGTVRGLHYQSPPYAQGKLVRCIKGSINDVAVDIRPQSSTYGHHIKVFLSAQNSKQFWIPEGFLHGFATLEENTEVAYKVTNFYNKKFDKNIQWNDPELAIDWGVEAQSAIVSDKDKNAEAFNSFISPFSDS